MTFANVTEPGGYAIVTTTWDVPQAVSPLHNATGPHYYFTVRAAFSGTVTVSLASDGTGMNETQKSSLQMAQFDGGALGWLDKTLPQTKLFHFCVSGGL